ncbi:Fungal-trans domain-containing protein [Pyrenophora tritici-repentis]|nr:Fungal-trans domain-containing protein [Pyrenophora tritici-repentis]KAI0608783.1 Fungal-trans domain-containing protein [Pyrenophora tritici-repentis]
MNLGMLIRNADAQCAELRCVEKGEDCDLKASRTSQSPIISSTANANCQQTSKSPTRSVERERAADTASSLQETQVRVLGHFTENDLSLTASGAVQKVTETSPTGTTSDCRVQSPAEKPPVPSEESEGALLIVEDLGRTEYTGLRSNKSFLLCVQDVLHATTRENFLDPADRNFLETPRIAKLPPIQSKESIEAIKLFPPREISSFLVSTFFYYVEATFFYCDKEWFHTTLNSVFTGNASGSAADDAFICFTLLVFAFGSQFAHLRSRDKPQDSLPPGLDPGKRFYDCAQKLIPRIIATCTLKGIQVCLLAGLYNLPYNLPDTAYLYLGMAMRMSIASGLHRKTLAAPRTSIALGRPSSIAEDAVDAPFPKYHSSLDELEYQSNVQHQVEYLKLTKIITQIVQNIPLESKLPCVEDLSQQLKQWRSQLFSNLHPNDLLPSERNFRRTVHLHIHYHWAWILMGCASLLQISRERIQALLSSAPSSPDQPHGRMDLVIVCVDAAKATIELILVLRKHNLLCRFSFTDHHASTAALIVLILHSILQQGDETSRIIDDGVDMLHYMARGGCRGASSDLQTIEQLRRLAYDLRKRIYKSESDSSTAVHMQPTDITNSYQAWVNWMSEQEASRSDVCGLENQHPQPAQEIVHGSSQLRGCERPFCYEAGSNDNMLYMPNDSSLDQGNLSWNFDMYNGSIDDGAVPRGFEWDDGRMDVLDMTQLLESHSGQTTYGQG